MNRGNEHVHPICSHLVPIGISAGVAVVDKHDVDQNAADKDGANK